MHLAHSRGNWSDRHAVRSADDLDAVSAADSDTQRGVNSRRIAPGHGIRAIFKSCNTSRVRRKVSLAHGDGNVEQRRNARVKKPFELGSSGA